MDAQDKSTSSAVCLHKTQNTISFKKLWSSLEHMSRGSLLWVYWIGLWIDHTKTAFQRVWGTMRSFFFPDFNTTDSNIDSPADTCGCGVPEGLKMSLVSPPPLIRAWWKTAVYQSSSVHQNTRQRLRKLVVNREKRNGLEQRERTIGAYIKRLWTPAQLQRVRLKRCWGRVPYVHQSHWPSFNLHAAASLQHVFWPSEPLKSHYIVQQQRF